MLNRLTAVIGITVLAAACGGSGGSTAANGTSGGATTGTATAGTTGGASTGRSLANGTPCSANSDCATGICGVNGSGNCCAAACAADGGTCGATSCDTSGACAFPDTSVACGTAFCGAGNKLTANACNGAGACTPKSATTCPGNFACNAAGDSCNSACTAKADCASGYTCNGGACVAPVTVGACTEDDDCFSGRCGVNGGGHCCFKAAGCVSGDPICGATDCDPVNGSCNYADAGVACGSVLASCTAGTQQSPSVCDGQGTCPTPTTKDCTPFICGANACLTSCTDNSSCGTGAFCDISHASCCSGLSDGASINVDGSAGSDATACCSIPGYGPCLTLTQAMKEIDSAQAKNVTINAIVRKGTTWAPASEVYPVVLGWGVELSGPGVFFLDFEDGGASAVFDIGAVSSKDTVGYASIVGTAKNPISIGMDEFHNQANSLATIKVESGSTLYIANAEVNGNEEASTDAFHINAGGSLILAQDHSAVTTGTVTIGFTTDDSSTLGFNGIVCDKSKTAGCTVSDATLPAGTSSVVIQGQINSDIDAEDFASISLTSTPIIGLAPTDAGFGTCPDKIDGENGAAVILNGKATVTFKNGVVQCIAAAGFGLQATSAGNPALTIDNSTIQHCQWGIDAVAGKATVTNSTIIYNYNGVEQDSDGINDGIIDLGGTPDGGTNTVICSDSAEGGGGIFGFGGVPGGSVINTTASPLNASNVTWDTSAPDLFGCDTNLDNCTCEISSCTNVEVDGGIDGLDAVTIGDAGTIDTSGNQLSPVDCNFPPVQTGGGGCGVKDCLPPLVCCPFIEPPQCLPIQICMID